MKRIAPPFFHAIPLLPFARRFPYNTTHRRPLTCGLNATPAMRRTLHKLLTYTLLATYAGISLLGQGLHWLTPDDCHHHGLSVVACTAHDHDHCVHREIEAQSSARPILIASGRIPDSHTCEICEFLIQAVSQPPQVDATPDLHVLIADLPCDAQGLYSPTILGLHAARGPPPFLA